MDCSRVISKRRSVRKFQSKAVEEKKLLRILDAGRWAPSAGNCQPWHFVVVTDSLMKASVAQICTKYSKEHWMKFPPERAKYLALRGGSWDKSHMKDIPVLIVVSYKSQEIITDELVLGSVWMAVENILLAATNEGLGSCVYTLLNRREKKELKRVLRADQADKIACMVQLGYTKVEPPAPHRKQLEEIVSYEHFPR